jgi:hypothetical protein
MIGTLARGGGTLAGAIVDGSARTWLTDTDGRLTLVMWPGYFRARFDPLEVIDEHGQVVARGGGRDGGGRVSQAWRSSLAWRRACLLGVAGVPTHRTAPMITTSIALA